MNDIAAQLLEVVDRYPDKTALTDHRRHVSYDELRKEVLRTVTHFREMGIREGHRALVLVPVSVDLYRVTMALHYLGAAAIFIEDWISPGQIRNCVRSTMPDAVIAQTKGYIFSVLDPQLRRIPLRICSGKFRKFPMDISNPLILPQSSAILSYTSGSSGIPKLVHRNFAQLSHQHQILGKLLGSNPAHSELVTLPAFVFLNLMAGASTYLASFNGRTTATQDELHRIYALCSGNRLNSLCCSIALLEKLCSNLSKPLAQIRRIVTGGSPLLPGLAIRLKTWFPQAEVLVLYGSSEVEPISSISLDDLIRQFIENQEGIPAGHPHPDTQVSFMLLPGMPPTRLGHIAGEICVSGKNALTAKDPAKPYPTGDSGYLNAAGQIVLCGPVQALFEAEGMTWSVFEFEAYCSQIAGVKRGAMCRHDKRIVALVLLSDTRCKEQVREAILRSHFPVEVVLFVPALPLDRRHSGKVLYSKLPEIVNKYR